MKIEYKAAICPYCSCGCGIYLVVKDGKIIFGAYGIGGLKMKVHRTCITRLFERNDLVLDAEEIRAIAREGVCFE